MSGPVMSDVLIRQILDIREGGKYNMFDIRGVQREAYARGYYELVLFMEEHRDQYARYILTGDRL